MHMHLIGISYIFMHMHYCTSFRYARCARVDIKHAVLESTHKAVLVDISRRWKDPLKQPKTRPKVERAQSLTSINTDLVLPQASPSAHPTISNYDTYIYFNYLCIKFRNYLEP